VTHGERLLEHVRKDPGKPLVHYKKIGFETMDSANFRQLVKKLGKDGKIVKKLETIKDTNISVVKLYPRDAGRE